MIALDTNVLVRALIEQRNADAITLEQQRRARLLLAGTEPLFIPASVILELEWVLRYVYEQPTGRIADIMADLLQVEHMLVERAGAIAQAVVWMRRGLDFADALHLLSSASCTELATFDRRLSARTKRLGIKPPCRLPEARALQA